MFDDGVGFPESHKSGASPVSCLLSPVLLGYDTRHAEDTLHTACSASDVESRKEIIIIEKCTSRYVAPKVIRTKQTFYWRQLQIFYQIST